MESLELEVYSLNFPMFAKPIIFHNKYFSNKFEGAYVPATRKGSSTDVKALVHMFMNHLNCLHPIVHKDKSAAEIKAIIKDGKMEYKTLTLHSIFLTEDERHFNRRMYIDHWNCSFEYCIQVLWFIYNP